MQNKGVFIILLLILLGIFAFIMFSPQAKKAVDTIEEQNVEIVNIGENNMEQNTTGGDPLIVEIVKEGSGNPAVSGDSVTVTYIGTLADGTEFDKSTNRGDGTFTFQVGIGEVIRGWDEGIVGMKVGEVRRLTIAPEYAYGDRAIGSIPANSTLFFEVEMFGINQ